MSRSSSPSQNGYKYKKFVDAYFEAYDSESAEVVAAALKKVHRIGKLEHLIDVGCGSGRMVNDLSKNFEKITAIDISEEQIAKAREKFSEVPNIHFGVGSCNKIPVNDASADVITSVFAAHYFDMELFVKECQRVLKPGGIVVLLCQQVSKVFPGKEFNVAQDAMPDATALWLRARTKMEQYAKEIGHPMQHVFDGYAKLFADIKGFDKSYDNSTEYDVEMTLDELQKYIFSMPFYECPVPVKAVKTFVKALKQQWGMNDDDITVRFTRRNCVITLTRD